MRVLLWMSSSGDGIQGGHQIQIQQTARHLELLGVSTRITYEQRPNLDEYDVIHSFGLDPWQIRLCWDHNLPVVSSPIYWTRDYAFGINSGAAGLAKWTKRLRMALVLARSALKGEHPQKCEAIVQRQWRLRVVYEMSDLLLPNSQSEADAIHRELDVSTPYIVATNAVAPDRYFPPPPETPRNGALFIGRFEPHKNQLGFIRAMKGSHVPVALMGFAHPHHTPYLEACKKEASRTKNVVVGAAVDQDKLLQTFQSARVHALPSWFETTGLVSLEAALCGCNIVTTSRGYANEFFEEMAWYCDPAKPETIRDAVEAAHESPVPPALRDRVLNRYTWRHTAEATLAGYKKVLTTGRRPRSVEDQEALLAAGAHP